MYCPDVEINLNTGTTWTSVTTDRFEIKSYTKILYSTPTEWTGALNNESYTYRWIWRGVDGRKTPHLPLMRTLSELSNPPTPLMMMMTMKSVYFEEVPWWSGVDSAVLDVGLLGEILRRFNGRLHAFSSQERSHVGRVRWYEDQSEEPPDTAHYSTRHRPAAPNIIISHLISY